MIQKGFIIGLFFSLSAQIGLAQSGKDWAAKAAAFAEKSQHQEALVCWEQAYKKDKKSLAVQYGRAAALAETGQVSKSLAIFRKLRYKPKKAEICFYLGLLYQQSGKHKEANLYYREFLRTASAQHPKRAQAKQQLAQLAHSQRLSLAAPEAALVNLADINSQYDELGLQRHPRADSSYFFSSNRPSSLFKSVNPNDKNGFKFIPNFNQNIWAASASDAVWKSPNPLNTRYNSAQSEQLLGFLDNGYQILYSQSNQPWVDNYDPDSVRLALPFAANWEGSYELADMYIYGEKLLIFSAKSADGYGGFDLYWSWLEQGADTIWTEPQNLGAGINTERDEISPFLATDGRTLYFSSQRSEGLGGFDVYKSRFSDPKLSWEAPQLLPPPINSYSNDAYFQPQADGVSAFLSSNRPEGQGGMDIYTVYFKKYLPEQEQFSNPATFAEVFLALAANTPQPSPQDSQNVQPIQPQKTILYSLKPVFFQSLLSSNEEMQNQADILAQILSQNADYKLFISCYTDGQTEIDMGYFLTIKHPELLANMLIEAGIAADRVYLLGASSQYPLAKEENYQKEPILEGQQLNRRLEFSLWGQDSSQSNVRVERAQVSPLLKSANNADLGRLQQGFYYSIELKQTAGLWRNELLKGQNVYTLRQMNQPNISYMQGFYPDFASAEAALGELVKNKKVQGAKIIPFYQKKPLTETEIAKFRAQFADFDNYLLYLQQK